MTLIASEIDQLLSEAARIAAGYLEGHGDRSEPVLRFLPPEELAARLDLEPPEKGRPLSALLEDVRTTLEHGVRTGSPRFFNQLYSGFDAAGILGEWIAAVMNTSMYTYEVAPVATLVERALLERMRRMVGFEDGEGVLTPGGSLSNLMAVLCARDRAQPGCKERGLLPGKRPALFISKEAHYSMQRAAAVAGLGLRSVVEVPTDRVGRMLPGELEKAVDKAKEYAQQPFLVCATSGTTVPGAFDPVAEIAEVAARHGLWLHVDASYGGTALFSERHRHLLDGIHRADSVCWNPHKMMGVPLACAALLMRKKGVLAESFGMNADYLFHESPGAEMDMGDLTLQCGRHVDAMKLWLSWRAHGDRGYAQRVETLFGLAGWFRSRVLERDGFHLAREPQSTNVCFHYLSPALRELPDGPERDRALEAFTAALREKIRESGRFLINYATLDDVATFRLVLCNPETTPEDLEALLDEMQRLGDALAAD